MKDVGDREVIAESSNHKNDRRQEDGGEGGNSCAPRGFPETRRRGVLPEQCEEAPREGVCASAQSKQEREASDIRHSRNSTDLLLTILLMFTYIFSEKLSIC